MAGSLEIGSLSAGQEGDVVVLRGRVLIGPKSFLDRRVRIQIDPSLFDSIRRYMDISEKWRRGAEARLAKTNANNTEEDLIPQYPGPNLA